MYAKPLLSHGLILSLPNSISLILPKVEKISWRWSLLTFLVNLPICIFVGGGVMLRFLFPPDLLRSRGFSATFSFLSSPPFTTSFRAGDGPPFFGDLSLSFFFLSLSFLPLSLLRDLLESELESLLESELESLLELLLELESRLFLLPRPSLSFPFLLLLLSGELSLPLLLSLFFLSFSLSLSPFSFPFSVDIFFKYSLSHAVAILTIN